MDRAIEKILNHFGYYKVQEAKGDPVLEKEVMEMFKEYGESKHFSRFLRDVCKNDVNLYFQARKDEERQKIRGAYERTKYFLALIKKSNEQTKQKRN